jgi:putative transposase
MITTDSTLSMTSKCNLLSIKRSTLYYKPVRTKLCELELELKRKIDKIHLKYPFMGSRRIVDQLDTAGHHDVGRKRVQRLMRQMSIAAIYPRPNTSRPGKAHRIYPYLLRNLTIDHPNQVWAADITYIPMRKGFVYLVVIMDWYSRRILSWRLSNSLESTFCVEALQEAIARYGAPEIFNTDQGSQFTGDDFITELKTADIRISMDGRGRWVDNVFVERLWRSLKYEEVYLKAYETVPEARSGIGGWIEFYNFERRHQSLNRRTPDQVFNEKPEQILVA